MRRRISEVRKQAEIAAQELSIATARLSYAINKLVKEHNVPEDCEAINQIRLVEANGCDAIIIQLNPENLAVARKASCICRPTNDIIRSLEGLPAWNESKTSARFLVGERNPTCSAELILSTELMETLSDKYSILGELRKEFFYREIFKNPSDLGVK